MMYNSSYKSRTTPWCPSASSSCSRVPRAAPTAVASGKEGSGAALHSIATALSHIQNAMQSMRCKMDRADGAMRGVTQVLNVQSEIIDRIDQRMNNFEGSIARGATSCLNLGRGGGSSGVYNGRCGGRAASRSSPRTPQCPARAAFHAAPTAGAGLPPPPPSTPCPQALRKSILRRSTSCYGPQQQPAYPPPLFTQQLEQPQPPPPQLWNPYAAYAAYTPAQPVQQYQMYRTATTPDVPKCQQTTLQPLQASASSPGRRKCVCPTQCYCSSPAPHPPSAPGAFPARCHSRRFRLLGNRLIQAARRGRRKAVRRLLDAGADPNFCLTNARWTPLHWAAAEGRPGAVATLLRCGADANARTCQGWTPLHPAAQRDYGGRCVELLLGAGADPDARSSGGRAPLHYAAESGNIVALRALLDAGASCAVKDRDGRRPVQLAVSDFARRLLRFSSKCPGRCTDWSRPCCAR